MFNRTVAGLINKFLFYPEPIIWVEGRDDFPFYEPILKEQGCRIEAAGGKIECLRLAEAVIEKNYPFVVVMDGDYDILGNTSNLHNRVIYLQKYSIENYLFEKRLIQNICCKYAGTREKVNEIGILFDEIENDLQNNLFELVILDIANQREQKGLEIFPSRAEPILDLVSVRCVHDRVTPILNSARISLRTETIKESKELVENYLQRERFINLVRGHFIFGVIRHLLKRCVQIVTNKKIVIDNDGLLIMLSLEIWAIKPTEFHLALEQNIRQAITDAFDIKHLQNIAQ